MPSNRIVTFALAALSLPAFARAGVVVVDGPGAGSHATLQSAIDAAGPDCNGNHVPDAFDIATGASRDFDADGVPDECP